MTTNVISQELDLSVTRALHFLHSSEPDSEEQLYQMWKQSILEKYGPERSPVSVLHKINIPSGLKRESNHEVSKLCYTLELLLLIFYLSGNGHLDR